MKGQLEEMGGGWGKRGMRIFAVEGRAGGVCGGRGPCRCSGRGVVQLYVSPPCSTSPSNFRLEMVLPVIK